MKKILEPGRKTFVTTCKMCGCKFSYEMEDVYGLGSVNCPNCANRCIHVTDAESSSSNDAYKNIVEYLSQGKLPPLG